ncbi:MAG TPA: fumarate hydratase [Burkholderiaceae bacterium]|jgi:fumarate hydratase subunit alpha|nr:fumarate hydratase [Burkholderiaceae bacterium]
MPIDSAIIQAVTASLYERSLKKIPDDTRAVLGRIGAAETNATARRTFTLMLESADAASGGGQLICSDVGIPTYSIKIGTRVQFAGPVRQAITDGFAQLAANINPPILKMVTHPLTHERSYAGKDIPIVSFDLIDDADYMDIVCAPKAMGTGRWEAVEAFVYPTEEDVEKYVLDVVLRAGSQPCLPIVVGVGIGGTFDQATRLAKEAVLRPHAQPQPDARLERLEKRLLDAINQLGFGAMGTGGDTSAMAVNVDYSASHGFVPIAVCFNCWINRRTAARIHGDGRVEMLYE